MGVNFAFLDNFLFNKPIINKFFTAFFIFMLVIAFSKAESYSIDPCGQVNINDKITGLNKGIYMQNNCLYAYFPLRFNPDNVIMRDKINNEDIALVFDSVEEKEKISRNQRKSNKLFRNLKATIINKNTIKYQSNKIWVTYTMRGNSIKIDAGLTNFDRINANSDLWMKYRIKETSRSNIKFIKPIVDGKLRNVEIIKITENNVDYYLENLGYGNNIILDPIYTVDYSPIPAIHLINGSVNIDSDNLFQINIDITTGLNDSSDATTFLVNRQRLIIEDSNKITWRMDGNSVSVIEDISRLSHDGFTNGARILGRFGNGINLSGANINISIENDLDFDVSSAEDMVMCISAIVPNSAESKKLVDKDSGVPDGVQIRVDSGEHIDFFVDRGSGSTINGATNLNDGLWHTICTVAYSNTTMELYIDNTFEVGGLSTVGSIDSVDPFVIGYDLNGGFDFEGSVDDFCYWSGIGLDFKTIRNTYETFGCAINNNQTAIASSWSVTYDPSFSWFLRLRKTSLLDDEFTVYGYNSNDSIQLSQNRTKTLSGLGWFNINVSGIVNYETNTALLNFTKLRFFSEAQSFVSEVVLRSESNDTIPPTIFNCMSNVSSISCLESVKFSCNVTDNIDVDFVNFTISNIGQVQTQKLDNVYSYIQSPTQNETIVYNFNNVLACDILGTCNTTNPDINVTYNCVFEDYINITHTGVNGVNQFNITNSSVDITWTTNNPSDSEVIHGLSPSNINISSFDGSLVNSHIINLLSLSANTTYYYLVKSKINPQQNVSVFNFTTLSFGCVENWILDPIVCTIGDNYTVTYTDSNVCGTTTNLPFGNGSVASCDYCQQDLVQTLGSCLSNATQTINYVDNNKISCCDITGLSTDCDILTFPFNSTTTQSCTFFNNTMGNISCQNEPDFGVREKEYCLAYIPQQYANESFKCISDVYRLNTNEIMQTNPEYTEKTETFINFGRDADTREFFAPANQIVNFYYTQKNLDPENDYVLRIQCSSQQRILMSQKMFDLGYEDLDFIYFRGQWLIGNMGYIIMITVIIILLLLWLFIIRSFA